MNFENKKNCIIKNTIVLLPIMNFIQIEAISLPILGFAAFYAAYYFIANASLIYNLFEKTFGKENNLVLWIVYQRLTGLLFLGIIPGIIALTLLYKIPESIYNLYIFIPFRDITFFQKDMSDISLNFLHPNYWILGSAALIIPINLVHARKPENIKIYPQIRVKEWNIRLILINTFTLAVYLFAYEFLFRGLLLFYFVAFLSPLAIIAINTYIYAFVHIPKGAKETLSAIPFGILLCVMTLDTGTIWAAFFVHLILALSNDFIAIHANPEMQFKKK